MMGKRFMQAAGVLILAFAMAAAGCKDDSTEEDTWTDITGLSQINGTWKGSAKETKTVEAFMKELGQPWDKTMAGILGADMEVAVDAEIVMAINASEKTQSSDVTMTMAFSKGNIDTVWLFIKQGMTSSVPEGITATPNDADHSVKIEMKSPPAPISAEDEKELLKGLQINQHGTKVKEPAQPANPEMGIPAIPEIIFEKQ